MGDARGAAGAALPDGFTLYRDAVADPDARLAALIAEVPWEEHVFRIFGREVPMPRRIAWFGEVAYRYSGVTHPAAPMPPLVLRIREEIRLLTGYDFNTVLLNFYRGGADGMGWHHDDDYAPRRTTAIASVSLGAARRFDLAARERSARSGGPLPHAGAQESDARTGPGRASVVLPHGSVLLMGEGAQRAWRHRLPKVAGDIGPRVNLTFRDMAG